jgi:outer membrane protein, heavy metal efflux system
MNIRYLILAAALILGERVNAQQSLDTLLTGIAIHNKTLRAEQERVSAASIQYKIGNTLPDPRVEYDLLRGFPSTAGNQNDLSVTQSLDFPTSYKKRKEVTRSLTSQVNYEQQVMRQKILLNAKLVAIEIIYLNRRIAELQHRYGNTEQFYQDYQKKYDRQDATILDLQKAKLQLLNIQTDLKLAQTQRQEWLQKLTEANGGQPVSLTDTIYPLTQSLPMFEPLHEAIDSLNPERKFYEAQIQSGQSTLALTRSMLLPKLEFGYHYQGILGQRFHGAHIGFSIPLWENRNKLQHQQFQNQFYTAQLEEHHTTHYSEIRQLYDKAVSLDSAITDYKEALNSLNNEALLRKSLSAGQMNTLQYYMELTLLYESRDKYLELEKEYHKAMAALFRHIL